uniref:Sister chromatid cohesion protein DCC1 n=1 Tax=Meloidogyne hapla TaxID=6305 RepID=A0A1I8BYV5_MELHA
MENLNGPVSNTNNSFNEMLFSPHFSPNDFIFVEMDKQLVNDFLNGNEICIRGYNSDEIVLCTPDETFCCKGIEVSNSLLILEDNGNLNEMELCEESTLISLELILCCAQASEEELINKLAELPVIELDGKFYWLSDEFILKLLERIAEAVDNNQNDEIALFTKEDLLQRISLKNAPMEAIDWLLNNFCDKKGGGKYSFNEQKVLRIYIENLLRSLPDKALNFADFELKINNTLPNGLYFKEEYLSGLGIIENSHFRGKVVNKLIATDLPLNLQERLSILFSKKSHWRKEEIQPYLLEYCLDPAKIEEFLMKNCKIVGSSSERFYVYKQLTF